MKREPCDEEIVDVVLPTAPRVSSASKKLVSVNLFNFAEIYFVSLILIIVCLVDSEHFAIGPIFAEHFTSRLNYQF